MTFMMPAMMLIMNCVTVMIVWFGAKGIDAGNLQVGDMMAFMTYTMQIVMSFFDDYDGFRHASACRCGSRPN